MDEENHVSGTQPNTTTCKQSLCIEDQRRSHNILIGGAMIEVDLKKCFFPDHFDPRWHRQSHGSMEGSYLETLPSADRGKPPNNIRYFHVTKR